MSDPRYPYMHISSESLLFGSPPEIDSPFSPDTPAIESQPWSTGALDNLWTIDGAMPHDISIPQFSFSQPSFERHPSPLLLNTNVTSNYASAHPPTSMSASPLTPDGISPSNAGYLSSPSLPGHTPATPAGTLPMGVPFVANPSPSPVSAIDTPTLWNPPKTEHSNVASRRRPSNTSPVQAFNSYPNTGSICRGPPIPQKRYKPHTSSDRRRYVEEVELEESIYFQSQHPSGDGIRLVDALNNKYANLVGRDDSMFHERGPSISVRINWPGYQPWSRQIPTRDFRNPPGPITRAKLAKNVAKSVHRFLVEHEHTPMEEEGEEQWAVGRNGIHFSDLALIRLDHVSKGSWQAQLQLLNPLRS